MKIIAFTGAGISKSAGIPTFIDIPGIKEKLSVEFKKEHYEEFCEAITLLKNNVRDKEPTKAHKILAKLQIPIITMNIDSLHKKAGSKIVYELHGNYEEDNIVLYGEPMHYAEESKELIINTASEAKENKEEAIFLIIGSSMQTVFANVLATLAEKVGMKVLYIDSNADKEVEMFFKLIKMI